MNCADAPQLIARLRKLISRHKMGHTERFEADAEEFYRDTGYIAPGKSVPMEMAASQPDSERDSAWYRWSTAQSQMWLSTLEQTADLLARLTEDSAKGERVFQAVVYAFEGREIPQDLRDHGMVRRALKFRASQGVG